MTYQQPPWQQPPTQPPQSPYGPLWAPAAPQAPPKSWRWLATLSIVFALIGALGVLSVAGLVCGMVAVDRAKAAREKPTAAWWGVWLSAGSLVWSAGTVLYLISP